MRGKIGIAISTCSKRPQYFLTVLAKIKRYRPKNSVIVIVEDFRDITIEDHDLTRGYVKHHFKNQVGIPTVKNKCIELLYDQGCEHFFLFDDDVYPIHEHWCQPYINSEYDHLCYTFLENRNDVLLRDYTSSYKTHLLANGCMMYMSKKCIDTIGGFDTEFGLGKFEHVEYSRRAYNAGVIPYPFIDVAYSDKLFISLDDPKHRLEDMQRTFTDEEQIHLASINSSKFYNKMNDKQFKNYKSCQKKQ